MNRRRDRLIARRFIDQLGMKDSMTIEQVLLMSTQQKIQLRATVNRTWESQWRQVTISFMDYFTSEGVEQTPEHNTRKRTYRDVRTEIAHHIRRTQTTLSKTGAPGWRKPPEGAKLRIPRPSSLLVASATDTGAGAGLPNPERTAGAASGEAASLARVPLVVATNSLEEQGLRSLRPKLLPAPRRRLID